MFNNGCNVYHIYIVYMKTIMLFQENGAVGKRVGHPWHERHIKLFLLLLCFSNHSKKLDSVLVNIRTRVRRLHTPAAENRASFFFSEKYGSDTQYIWGRCPSTGIDPEFYGCRTHEMIFMERLGFTMFGCTKVVVCM